MKKTSNSNNEYISKKSLIGVVVLFIGISIISTSFTMTGNVISQNNSTLNISTIISVILVILGITFLFLGNREIKSKK